MMKLNMHKMTLPHKQAGFSLMEVLVSVFLVGFALLALVAMQVKTHAGVREAENLTIVAMAVDSLAEGMRANPTLASSKVTIGTEEVVKTTKSWPDYTTAAYTSVTTPCTDPSGAFTKATLVTKQLCQFKATLATIPDAINVTPTIVNGKITVTWKTGKGTDTRSYEVTVD